MAVRVLVVDDSMMIRQQMGRALAEAGFAVTEAKDGVEALEQLAAVAEIGLIVCDFNMPRMNGIEFLQRLRSDGAVSGIPVLMLTTEGNRTYMHQAKQLGAKAWILKPFKSDLVIAAIKKITSVAA